MLSSTIDLKVNKNTQILHDGVMIDYYSGNCLFDLIFGQNNRSNRQIYHTNRTKLL